MSATSCCERRGNVAMVDERSLWDRVVTDGPMVPVGYVYTWACKQCQRQWITRWTAIDDPDRAHDDRDGIADRRNEIADLPCEEAR